MCQEKISESSFEDYWLEVIYDDGREGTLIASLVSDVSLVGGVFYVTYGTEPVSVLRCVALCRMTQI